MKRMKHIILAVLLISGTQLNAQSYYDANRLMGQDLDGTARFISMGGAMSALGGDLSVMGTNPAGIGIYRSSDANVSFGFTNTTAKSNFQGLKMDTDKNSFSFGNVGFVIAMKNGDHTPLRFVNFGFNARTVKSFYRNMSTNGIYNYSQTQQFANMVNENSNIFGSFLSPEMLLSNDAYVNSDKKVPWLGAMAYEAFLLPQEGAKENYLSYFDSDKHRVDGLYESKEKGGIYAYDFNIAFNLYDRVYLGATIGAYDVDYERSSTYSEIFALNDGSDDGNYALTNRYKVEGTGVDFKLGTIVRPFEYSSFRIGASVTTPIYYRLTEHHTAFLQYDNKDTKGTFVSGDAYPQNQNGGALEGRTEYKIRTPWKYNLSLGYTAGSQWAFGAEYEYMDYSSASMKYDHGVKIAVENDYIDTYLKGVNTFRLGAEYRFVPEFSIRAGFNHVSSSIDEKAYMVLPIDAIRTDTEYANGKAINNYTFGFGYRSNVFYADMAYKYQTQKDDFYAFDNTELAATTITNNRHQLMLTLGVRF